MPSSCLSNQLHAKKREFPPVEVSSADETLAPQHAGVAVPVPAQTPAPVKPTQPKASPSSTPHGRSHGLRTGAARGTRSGNQETVHAFEWEEVDLAKSRSSPIRPEVVITVRPSPGSKQANVLTHLTPKMSRNRPRAPRDNGIAATEETELWTKIVGDMKLAQEKNDRQKVLGEQIKSLNEKVGKEGTAALKEHDELDNLYRQMAKMCEEERAILQDEPHDVLKNLQLLTALRQASEAEAPGNRAAALSKSRKKKGEMDGSSTESPGPSGVSVSDKVTRVKGTAPRSTSVSSSQPPRDNVMVKVEEGVESTKGTIAERSGQLVVGAEVVFKHNKNKQGIEGEGIQCIIKTISGEGHRKRYDIQDPEPNENGEQGAVYRTGAASLIPIPKAGSTLPSFSVGKQVLARYPDTTTFYRAEVMGSKKDTYRLKFEGEEDDKEMEVDKRFVLDIPGK